MIDRRDGGGGGGSDNGGTLNICLSVHRMGLVSQPLKLPLQVNVRLGFSHAMQSLPNSCFSFAWIEISIITKDLAQCFSSITIASLGFQLSSDYQIHELVTNVDAIWECRFKF